MNAKRTRGRPPGAGARDYTDFLNRAADVIVCDPNVRPTVAMKRIIADFHGPLPSNSPDALLRRLQDKWKKHSGEYLSDAKDRAERNAQQERNAVVIAGLIEYQKILQDIAASEEMRNVFLRVGETVTAVSKSLEPVAEQINSTVMRVHSYLEQHPEVKARLEKFAVHAQRAAR
jgi:chaperonin cofactor prefoldin